MATRKFVVIATEVIQGVTREYVYSGRAGMVIGKNSGHFVINAPHFSDKFRLLEEQIANDLAESFTKKLEDLHGQPHEMIGRVESVDFNFDFDSSWSQP